MDKLRAGQGVDRRTREGRAYKEMRTALLVHVRDTSGQPATLPIAIACDQVAQLSMLVAMFWEWALRNEAEGKGEPMSSLSKRYLECCGKLDKALGTLARLIGQPKNKLQDSFGDQLASLRVAVPVGEPQAQTQKPKRAKPGGVQ